MHPLPTVQNLDGAALQLGDVVPLHSQDLPGQLPQQALRNAFRKNAVADLLIQQWIRRNQWFIRSSRILLALRLFHLISPN
jgi:hypothetical protein